MRMPRRITMGLAAAVAALMLVAAPLPAQAADPKLDMTKLYVKSIVLGPSAYGEACRDLAVVPTFVKAKGVRDEEARINFIQDNKIWRTTTVEPGKNYEEWCPGKGFGKHVAEGEYVAAHANSGYSYFSRTDNTKTTFYVRGKSKATLKAKRATKKTVKLSVAAKTVRTQGAAYHDTVAYKPYAAKKVAFQVKSGKKWKTFKTVNLGKKGTATVTVKRSSKANYRVVVPKTNTSAGVTTGAVKK